MNVYHSFFLFIFCCFCCCTYSTLTLTTSNRSDDDVIQSIWMMLLDKLDFSKKSIVEQFLSAAPRWFRSESETKYLAGNKKRHKKYCEETRSSVLAEYMKTYDDSTFIEALCVLPLCAYAYNGIGCVCFFTHAPLSYSLSFSSLQRSLIHSLAPSR